jgi:hypothetical protein
MVKTLPCVLLYCAARASSGGLLFLHGPHQCALKVTQTCGVAEVRRVRKASADAIFCNMVRKKQRSFQRTVALEEVRRRWGMTGGTGGTGQNVVMMSVGGRLLLVQRWRRRRRSERRVPNTYESLRPGRPRRQSFVGRALVSVAVAARFAASFASVAGC